MYVNCFCLCVLTISLCVCEPFLRLCKVIIHACLCILTFCAFVRVVTPVQCNIFGITGHFHLRLDLAAGSVLMSSLEWNIEKVASSKTNPRR